jgi:hypothetical protein
MFCLMVRHGARMIRCSWFVKVRVFISGACTSIAYWDVECSPAGQMPCQHKRGNPYENQFAAITMDASMRRMKRE